MSYSGIKLPIHTAGSVPTLAIRAIPCSWLQAGGMEHRTVITYLPNQAYGGRHCMLSLTTPFLSSHSLKMEEQIIMNRPQQCGSQARKELAGQTPPSEINKEIKRVLKNKQQKKTNNNKKNTVWKHNTIAVLYFVCIKLSSYL